MDSRKIAALLLAVDCGSLTGAAEQLGYTQAGLTHMMNNLESETGLTLLERSKNGVRLTNDGETLLPAMSEFVASSRRLEHEIADLRTRGSSTVRVGAYTSVLRQWLPDIIRGFRSENPGVNFELRDSSTSEMSRWVNNRELDICIGSRQEDDECRFIKICDDPLFAVLPENYPDCPDIVPIEIFQGSTFLMPTFGYDNDVLRALRKNNVEPVINSTSVGDASVVAMVRMGLGVSILPELVLRSVDTGGTLIRPIAPYCVRELGLIVAREKSGSVLAHRFIRYCEKNLLGSEK